MKRLVRTLQLLAAIPSLAQKVTAWLLNKAHTNLPLIPTDFQLESRSLLRVLSRPLVSPSSEPCKRLSLALATMTPGGLSKMSRTSCANFGSFDEEGDLQGASLKALGQVLKMSVMKKTARTPILPKMSSCATVPPSSGRGRPL